MEKEFVTYEQALALKELGFDDECCGYYSDNILYIYEIENKNLCNGAIVCALKQQVFRWFREKRNLIGLIESGYDNGINMFSYVIWRGSFDNWIDIYWDTYEEAENACIDKLIEITKELKS